MLKMSISAARISIQWLDVLKYMAPIVRSRNLGAKWHSFVPSAERPEVFGEQKSGKPAKVSPQPCYPVKQVLYIAPE